MEYLHQLDGIDSENVGESWIEILMHQFNFPDDPFLYECFDHLNERLKNKRLKSKESICEAENSSCNCSSPFLNDPFYWTTMFEIEETKLVILCSYPAPWSQTKVPDLWELDLARQGILLLRNYVSPKCTGNREHTAWKMIVDNILEFTANNFPLTCFLMVGETPSPYDFLRKSSPNVLEFSKVPKTEEEEKKFFESFVEEFEED